MIDDKELIKLIFGLKIKYLRNQMGLSYKELSDQSGIGLSYLHEIEKGKKYPKADKILKLAEVLEVDYDALVSLKSNRTLQPVLNLIKSDFFKVFPLETFGIDRSKLIELFLDAPERLNAFVSTVEKIIRSHHINEEDFYLTALRSYQNIHNNYFSDIEKAVIQFKKEQGLKANSILKRDKLISILKKIGGLSIDTKTLSRHKVLSEIRSYYDTKKRILYLNEELSDAQICFLVAREIGFIHLNLTIRHYETRVIDVRNYEKLLSNFKASYFAGALLINEQSIVKDLQIFFKKTVWQPNYILKLLKKYNATPEMFFQRLMTILPHHFNIDDLFFLRLHSRSDLKVFSITKELHLNKLHEPYANYMDEKYCRRWVSIEVLKKIRILKDPAVLIADGQISAYHNSDNKYILWSIAKKNHQNPKEGTSVNIGLKLNAHLSNTLKFINDPKLITKTVHTTCQRCSIEDCLVREANPQVIEKAQELTEIEKTLNQL